MTNETRHAMRLIYILMIAAGSFCWGAISVAKNNSAVAETETSAKINTESIVNPTTDSATKVVGIQRSYAMESPTSENERGECDQLDQNGNPIVKDLTIVADSFTLDFGKLVGNDDQETYIPPGKVSVLSKKGNFLLIRYEQKEDLSEKSICQPGSLLIVSYFDYVSACKITEFDYGVKRAETEFRSDPKLSEFFNTDTP